MSFAIIETGGKQYKVSTSKILEIEKLDAKKGETIKFKNVLLLNDNQKTEIGSPSVEGATVEAKLLDNVKDRTILVFQKKKKKLKKKNGHRQQHSKIQITKILAKGGKVIDEAKIVEKKKVVKETKKDIKKTEKNRKLNGNKKAGGSSRNGRDSKGRRLELKDMVIN